MYQHTSTQICTSAQNDQHEVYKITYSRTTMFPVTKHDLGQQWKWFSNGAFLDLNNADDNLCSAILPSLVNVQSKIFSPTILFPYYNYVSK